MITCMICHLVIKKNGFGSHLKNKHNTNMKEYYDSFIKKDNEGLCGYCNNPTNFINLAKGYNKYCSCKCAQSSNNVKHKQHNSHVGKKRPDMVGKNNPAKRPEVRKKLSDFITENNPMKHEEYRNKVKQYMLNNHPMKGKTYEELYGIEKAAKLKEIRRQQMLNGQAGEMCRSMPSTTKPQLKLYEIIKKLYPNTLIELEFPMNNYTLDIAIPYYKIDIEYDCSYWHTKIKDDRRDNYMLTMGWNVLRIIDNIPDNDTIYNKIEKIKTDAQAKQCAITFADSVS